MENCVRDLKGNRCTAMTLMLQRYVVEKDLAHIITVSRMELI